MGSECPQGHACQTRVRDGNRQHHEPDGQQILALFFPPPKCASLDPGYVADDGLLDSQHLQVYIYDDDVSEASEQEASEKGGGHWCSADLVPLVGRLRLQSITAIIC